MNQLLQEKRDAERFLKLIAPKYAGVYILDRTTDSFRDILAPEAFRAIPKPQKVRIQMRCDCIEMNMYLVIIMK